MKRKNGLDDNEAMLIFWIAFLLFMGLLVMADKI